MDPDDYNSGSLNKSKMSILKARRRQPLQAVSLGCNDEDEDNTEIRRRRVSFAGVNKIKEFNSDAESVVVCDTPAYEEEFTSSDSSQIVRNLSFHCKKPLGNNEDTYGVDDMDISSICVEAEHGRPNCDAECDMDLTALDGNNENVPMGRQSFRPEAVKMNMSTPKVIRDQIYRDANNISQYPQVVGGGLSFYQDSNADYGVKRNVSGFKDLSVNTSSVKVPGLGHEAIVPEEYSDRGHVRGFIEKTNREMNEKNTINEVTKSSAAGTDNNNSVTQLSSVSMELEETPLSKTFDREPRTGCSTLRKSKVENDFYPLLNEKNDQIHNAVAGPRELFNMSKNVGSIMVDSSSINQQLETREEAVKKPVHHNDSGMDQSNSSDIQLCTSLINNTTMPHNLSSKQISNSKFDPYSNNPMNRSTGIPTSVSFINSPAHKRYRLSHLSQVDSDMEMTEVAKDIPRLPVTEQNSSIVIATSEVKPLPISCLEIATKADDSMKEDDPISQSDSSTDETVNISNLVEACKLKMIKHTSNKPADPVKSRESLLSVPNNEFLIKEHLDTKQTQILPSNKFNNLSSHLEEDSNKADVSLNNKRKLDDMKRDEQSDEIKAAFRVEQIFSDESTTKQLSHSKHNFSVDEKMNENKESSSVGSSTSLGVNSATEPSKSAVSSTFVHENYSSGVSLINHEVSSRNNSIYIKQGVDNFKPTRASISNSIPLKSHDDFTQDSDVCIGQVMDNLKPDIGSKPVYEDDSGALPLNNECFQNSAPIVEQVMDKRKFSLDSISARDEISTENRDDYPANNALHVNKMMVNPKSDIGLNPDDKDIPCSVPFVKDHDASLQKSALVIEQSMDNPNPDVDPVSVCNEDPSGVAKNVGKSHLSNSCPIEQIIDIPKAVVETASVFNENSSGVSKNLEDSRQVNPLPNELAKDEPKPCTGTDPVYKDSFFSLSNKIGNDSPKDNVSSSENIMDISKAASDPIAVCEDSSSGVSTKNYDDAPQDHAHVIVHVLNDPKLCDDNFFGVPLENQDVHHRKNSPSIVQVSDDFKPALSSTTSLKNKSPSLKNADDSFHNNSLYSEETPQHLAQSMDLTANDNICSATSETKGVPSQNKVINNQKSTIDSNPALENETSSNKPTQKPNLPLLKSTLTSEKGADRPEPAAYSKFVDKNITNSLQNNSNERLTSDQKPAMDWNPINPKEDKNNIECSLTDVRLPGEVFSPLQRFNKRYMEDLGYHFVEWTKWKITFLKKSIIVLIEIPWNKFDSQTPISNIYIEYNSDRFNVRELGFKCCGSEIVRTLYLDCIKNFKKLGDANQVTHNITEFIEKKMTFFESLNYLMMLKAAKVIDERLSITVTSTKTVTAATIYINLGNWQSLSIDDVTMVVHEGEVSLSQVRNHFALSLSSSREMLYKFVCDVEHLIDKTKKLTFPY